MTALIFYPPRCCKKYMELKSAYWSGSALYVFQCSECGRIVKGDECEIKDIDLYSKVKVKGK